MAMNIIQASALIELKQCNSNGFSLDILSHLCKVHQNYSKLDFPTPTPTSIKTELRIQEIVEISEDHQLINIILKLVMEWNDTRISFEFNERNKGSYFPWVLLDSAYISRIWRPNVHWSNSVKILKLPSLNQNTIGSFWYHHPNHFFYQEYLQLSLSCGMDFQHYPYDSHECIMSLTNVIGNLALVTLQSPLIYAGNVTQNSTGKSYTAQKDKLQFDVWVEPLNSTIISAFGTNYSTAQVKFHLKRKSTIISNLLSSYYAPTSVLAFMSLISFSIDPNVVPGRMGMLITLILIITNTYNSIDAAPNRGFSYVEVWYIGIIVPIFIGIIEYGLILALKKYGDNIIKMDKHWLFQTIDISTLFICAILLAIFNVAYWLNV